MIAERELSSCLPLSSLSLLDFFFLLLIKRLKYYTLPKIKKKKSR